MPDEWLMVAVLWHQLVLEIPSPGAVHAHGGRLLEVVEIAVLDL